MELKEPGTNQNSLEQSNKKLMANLQESLNNKETFEKVSSDFKTTFERLGTNPVKSENFSQFVLSSITGSKTIEEAEVKVKSFFESEKVNDKTIFELIKDGLEWRFNIITGQLEPYVSGMNGKVIDFGCGSGSLTQIFHNKFGLDIEGVDVRDFRGKGVTIPIQIFDGYKIDVADKNYENAILTNVIHHEKNNEEILKELDRIVRSKLVIIETVPEADTEEESKKDWGRMLLNDTLWNRFFNYANIPVPGTYETPKRWIERFEKYGWKVKVSEDLGFDQPTIQDRHHLLVFER